MEITNAIILQVEKGKLTPGKSESQFETYKVVAYILMEKSRTILFRHWGSQLKILLGAICVYRITLHIPRVLHLWLSNAFDLDKE